MSLLSCLIFCLFKCTKNSSVKKFLSKTLSSFRFFMNQYLYFSLTAKYACVSCTELILYGNIFLDVVGIFHKFKLIPCESSRMYFVCWIFKSLLHIVDYIGSSFCLSSSIRFSPYTTFCRVFFNNLSLQFHLIASKIWKSLPNLSCTRLLNDSVQSTLPTRSNVLWVLKFYINLKCNDRNIKVC